MGRVAHLCTAPRPSILPLEGGGGGGVRSGRGAGDALVAGSLPVSVFQPTAPLTKRGPLQKNSAGRRHTRPQNTSVIVATPQAAALSTSPTQFCTMRRCKKSDIIRCPAAAQRLSDLSKVNCRPLPACRERWKRLPITRTLTPVGSRLRLPVRARCDLSSVWRSESEERPDRRARAWSGLHEGHAERRLPAWP